jgi:hypothetical protein
MRGTGCYVLDEDYTPRETDCLTSARWKHEQIYAPAGGLARVGMTEWEDGSYLSTVFIGIDMSFGDWGPLLWETMAFPTDQYDFQERYTSIGEAISGHKVAVQLMMMTREEAGLPPTPTQEVLAVLPEGSPLR